MAQNSAYCSQQQQPKRQYTQVYPQTQPQNIYQQLGKPQPQPHLQGHPAYQQSSALVVQPQEGYPFTQHHAQQLPDQVQTSFPLGEAPHAPPQTSYQLSQIPHVSPQTPYPQSQTPYLPSQPPYAQSQASYPVSQQLYTSSQTPYQQAQYSGQQSQQAYSSPSQLQVSYLPQTSFTSQTLAAVPTSSSGSSWRVLASWPPPVAHSATLAQQAQSQVQTLVQPQATSQTLAQRPLPLPQLSTGAILPFTSQSADNPSPGSSRALPTLAIQATEAPSSNSHSPKHSRPLPTHTGTTDEQAKVDLGILPHLFSSSLAISAISTQSSISSQPQPISSKHAPSPSKRSLPATSSHSPVKNSEWNNFPSLPAAVSTIPKSTSTTTSSSIPTTSATTSNSSSDTSVPPPKKFTPIWKRTIPHYPAPAWGYAVGMVSDPHPKPKAQLPAQPAPAKAPPANDAKGKSKEQNKTITVPPPPVPTVSSAKGITRRQQYSPSQYRQLGHPSTSFIQSGVQQRRTYQQRRRQQQQAYSGHARLPATYSETLDEDEEDSEEDSEEETDSDEEDEDDDENEEQSDPRYNLQRKRQKYTRPMASGAGVPSQRLSRGYDQNFEEMISTPTPKRKLRMKPKVKMKKVDPYTTYMDINTTNGRKSRIVPRRAPKASKKCLKPKKRIRVRPAGGLICGGCNGSIIGRIVSAMGSRWHPACFRCTVCDELLEHVSSYEHEGRPYCHLDYHEVRSSVEVGENDAIKLLFFL